MWGKWIEIFPSTFTTSTLAYEPGQGIMVQSLCCKSLPGQKSPPWAGGGLSHMRVLFCWPSSHVTEHWLHGDQPPHAPSTTNTDKQRYIRTPNMTPDFLGYIWIRLKVPSHPCHLNAIPNVDLMVDIPMHITAAGWVSHWSVELQPSWRQFWRWSSSPSHFTPDKNAEPCWVGKLSFTTAKHQRNVLTLFTECAYTKQM